MFTYDIGELKVESGNLAKLLFRLWDIWREAGTNATLLPEEQIVRDAWTYDTANGNGICDLIINERYDELAAGLHALRQLSSPKLDLYVETIAGTFNRFGIGWCHPESMDWDLRRCEPLLEALETAEKPFLQTLWDGAIIEAAQAYIERHIAVFRTRRQPP